MNKTNDTHKWGFRGLGSLGREGIGYVSKVFDSFISQVYSQVEERPFPVFWKTIWTADWTGAIQLEHS